MNNPEIMHVHPQTELERRLGDRPSVATNTEPNGTLAAADGFAIISASGFAIISASGFAII